MFDHEINDATREPSPNEARESSSSGTFSLLVVDDEGCERHVLPSRGEIVIGRSSDADVQVRRPWISRRHAVLRIGEHLTIEDAGSSYGLKVRGEAARRCELVPGDVIEIGSTMLLVQRRDASLPDRASFLAELRDDCARAAKLGLEVDVVAIENVDDVALALLSAHALTRFARLDGCCVCVAHRAAAGEPLATRIASQLAARGVAAAIGSATMPRDGDRAETLLDRATRGFASLGDHALVFADDATMALRAEVERLARTDAHVVFEGETGTGKDALAELLHESKRTEGRVVRLSRTDLVRLTELPTADMVILDGVTELSDEVQARLVSLLFPSGGPRIVTMSQKPLGSVRPDLYFRLAGAHLFVPPLRERPRDVEALAQRFVTRAAETLGRRRAPSISPELTKSLLAHPWPGNVRELENALTQAVSAAEGVATLRTSDVPRLIAEHPSQNLRTQLAALERQRIVDALERAGGNQSRAARDLGMPRNTLLARIREYGLPQPRKDKQRLLPA